MKCDAEGFAAMYSTVYMDMYRFALCMMKSSHDAEDAVSEAVVKAYESIGTLRSEEAFKSWFFTILANTCRTKWRRQEREQKKAELSFFTEEDAAAPEWEKAVDVRNAFAILTEEEQIALLATNGKLVKRPLVVTERFVLVGFKPEEWEKLK